MQFQFKWETPIAETAQSEVEERLSYDFETHPPIQTCHSGVVLVTLSLSESCPYLETIVGNVKCSCGKAKGILRGGLHGAIEYSPIDDL